MYHLTTPQQNIWNLLRFYEGTSISNNCGAIFYEEKRDHKLLNQAINCLIEAQDGMRLRFTEEDGAPAQYVAEYCFEQFPSECFDSQEAFDTYAQRFAKLPFDLFHSAMYRFVIFDLDGKTGVLMGTSHLIADAWAVSIIASTVSECYDAFAAGKEPELRACSYTDFMEAEQKYLNSSRYEKDKTFWAEQYFERPEISSIKPNSAPVKAPTAKRYTTALSAALTSAIDTFCTENNVSQAVLFEAAITAYLSRINPENHTISLGVPVLNRVNAAQKQAVGMCISTTPLTVPASATQSMMELCEAITASQFALFRHQRFPYSHILHDLHEKFEFTGNLYDVIVSFQNAKNNTTAKTQWYSNGYCEVGLEFHIDNRDNSDCYTLNIDYQTELFSQEDEIRLLICRIVSILEQMISAPSMSVGELSILPQEEYQKVIFDFNDTAVDFPREKCVHTLFAEQVQRTPEKIVLVFEDKQFTYRQLDEMSNSLAHHLRGLGVKPACIVPIISIRSWHVIVAMLGILKAGGAYMPVDPSYPKDRIQDMLDIARCSLALTYGYSEPLAIKTLDLADVDYDKDAAPIDNQNTTEDLCYVVFTSGSTGKPKGVSICHRNVVNYSNNDDNNVCHRIIETNNQSIVSGTNIIFDIFVTESLLPLLNGICIYFANDDQVISQKKLAGLIASNAIDIMQTTPTKMRSYIMDKQNVEYLKKLKAIALGGEALPTDLYLELRSYTEARIFNIYGPAETTVWSTNKCVEDTQITIGKPIANTQVYILDESHKPLPIGVAGELCISGEGVGKGYLNRPELTVEKFVPDPFRPRQTMYCTGDLARWRADGEIEYLGRIDTQVKIRGLRIELGEIESVMSSFEGIGLTAVTDKRDETGRQYLVGYYTAESEIDEKTLRHHLSAKLPKYMVPNYFVHLDAMPMTASGKIDRKNLPVPEFAKQARIYIAPETPTEQKIATMWEELLRTEQIGKSDDFFDLGGDSLVAIYLLTELETAFNVAITAKDIIEHSELEQLAAFIDNAEISAVKIYPTGTKHYTLLPQQMAIYTACSKEKDSLAYNMPTRIVLPKEIDRQKLASCIMRLLDIHPELKSSIRTVDGTPCAVIDDEAMLVIEECQDEQAFVRSFDLAKAPLMRVAFTEDALFFDMHHIIADGESLNIILRDLAMLYAGITPNTPAICYADYGAYFHAADFSEHKSYFKEMLKCDFEPMVLPEKKHKGTDSGVSRFYQIDRQTFEMGKKIAHANKLTDTMVFLGAFGLLLSKYTGRKDVLSSVVMTNRTHRETENTVGMFVNTLPIMLSATGSTADYFTAVRELVLNLFKYQEIPFFSVAEAVGMQDKLAVNTSFVYQAGGEKTLKLGSQSLSLDWVDTHTSKFDLTFELTPNKNGCGVRIEYNCGKFDQTLIDKLFQTYVLILEQLGKEQIADISVLSPMEYQQVIYDFNTDADLPRDRCVHTLFAEQVQKTPGKTALVFEDKQFTYRELDEMSNSLAHHLRGLGVKSGSIIPIISIRSWHVIVAILGILKAGGAYMPVDPSYPKERIQDMLDIAQCSLALSYGYGEILGTETLDLGNFDYNKDTGPVDNQNTSEDLCYIIFTSGSTGKPKGVSICHRNVANYALAAESNITVNYVKNHADSIISTTNYIFDIFVTESLMPLLNGLAIYFANDKQVYSQKELAVWIESQPIDVLQTTPTKMRSYIADKQNLDYLKRLGVIILGGEAFPTDLYLELARHTDAEIFNIYGPAETTVWSTNKHVKDSSITIGKPIVNTQIYILDAERRPLPVGVAGELCISGDGVGKGYLNRPDLTAEKFIPDPFRPGQTMYCTGDLARWRADGEIEYLGRIDTQVKIRGLRIELGEIESVMSSFAGIGLMAVTDKRDETGRQYLVGYYTAESEIDEKALRQHLSSKLPKYMVPNYFMHLMEMPMTASGKTDRKNLPVVEFKQIAPIAEYTAPAGKLETLIAKLMERVLNYAPIGREDDFFELGGDSLKAIELISALEHDGYHADVKTIFENPIVCELAEKLTEVEQKTTLIHTTKDVPASPAQMRVYTAQAIQGGTAYNVPYAFRAKNLQPDRLQNAVQALVDRHEVFRTRFEEIDGHIMQAIEPSVSIKVERLNSDDVSAFIRPFDLATVPLLRVGYCGDTVIMDMHHIITDGSSMFIFFRELNELYMGRALETTVQYREFATQSQNYAESEAYWLSVYSDELPELELMTDRKREQRRSYEGNVIYDRIDKTLHSSILAQCKGLGVTPYTFYMAAFYILLSKFSGNEDIVVGMPVSGRSSQFLNAIGMFVNTVALRNQPAGDKTVREFLDEVKHTSLDALVHQGYPYNELVKKLGLKSNDRNPLFDVMFAYQNVNLTSVTLGDQKAEILPVPAAVAKYDITFTIIPEEENAIAMAEYTMALYEEQTIRRFVGAYCCILKQMLDEAMQIKDISASSEWERTAVLYEFNHTQRAYPKEQCIHELFEKQVAKTPDKIAVIANEESLTYKELNERANRIAHGLMLQGVGRGDIVAFALPRTKDLVAVIFGILKSGAAYLPIDPDYPQERIDFIITDSAAKLLVTQTELINLLSCKDSSEPAHTATSEDICYCIYTSGSTGTPKGTLLKHRGLINLVTDLGIYRDLSRCSRIGFMTTITFDVASQEIFTALLNGFTGVLMPERRETTPAEIIEGVLKHKIDLMYATPTYFDALTDTDEKAQALFGQIKVVALAGEAFTLNRCALEAASKNNVIFENQYGPAETHVITAAAMDGLRDVHIGKPIANTQIYIVDKYFKPVPIGVTGELCIAGDGVGVGYLKRPELTAEKFIDNPFGEGKLYRTGDLAYWRNDGNIMFVGRNDFQVKIRGLRIELGEIESAISEIDGISQVVVIVRKAADGRQLICAFYTGTEISAKEIRSIIGQKLPKYMLPHICVHLDELPKTPSGKISRKALPEIDTSKIERSEEYVKPEGDLEKRLAAFMEQVLDYSPIGRTDDFFDLGGDSLKAIEFVSKAHNEGIYFALQNIFDYPTVEQLTQYINSGNKAQVSYADVDFSKFDAILEKNTTEDMQAPQKVPVGNVLLTGATGFLGAHILADFLDRDDGIAYCPVRGKDSADSKKRLADRLQFYFGDKYADCDRIQVICADLQKERFGLDEADYSGLAAEVDTVINAAASVKHYGSYQYFYDVNVVTVERLVDFCKRRNAKLVHISTVGVSGDTEGHGMADTDKYFYENSLYIDQVLDTVYARSKFEAELVVLRAINEGLHANIMRMGNLMSRSSDGVFQPNYETNAWLRRFKAFWEMKIFPDYLIKLYAEFTPIDEAARAVMLLTRHFSPEKTVFHIKNHKMLRIDELSILVEKLGHSFAVVDGAEFTRALRLTAQEKGREYIFESFIDDMDSENRIAYSKVHIESDFTAEYLRQLGFEWSEIGMDYLKKYIGYFEKIGFLSVT